MKKDGTDTGRKQHLITKTCVTTVTTAVFAIALYREIPKITKKLAQKMTTTKEKLLTGLVVGKTVSSAYVVSDAFTSTCANIINADINFDNLLKNPKKELNKLSLSVLGFDFDIIDQLAEIISSMPKTLYDNIEFSEITINAQTSVLPAIIVNEIGKKLSTKFELKKQMVDLFARVTFGFNFNKRSCTFKVLVLSAGVGAVKASFLTKDEMAKLQKNNVPTNNNIEDIKENSKKGIDNLSSSIFVDFRWNSKWKEDVVEFKNYFQRDDNDVLPTLFVEGSGTFELNTKIKYINQVQPYGIWASSGQLIFGVRVGFNAGQVREIKSNQTIAQAFWESASKNITYDETKKKLTGFSVATIPFILWWHY